MAGSLESKPLKAVGFSSLVLGLGDRGGHRSDECAGWNDEGGQSGEADKTRDGTHGILRWIELLQGKMKCRLQSKMKCRTGLERSPFLAIQEKALAFSVGTGEPVGGGLTGKSCFLPGLAVAENGVVGGVDGVSRA